ncbi:MAG: chemotaxis protein CheW [Actinomycetota bacterium]
MDDDIIEEFLVEAFEGLDQLEHNFVTLESTPDDEMTLKEAFRTLHTIKGTCGFLGFEQLEIVAHRGENLMSQLREGALSMNQAITDALLATADRIRLILEQIESTGAEGTHDSTELIARLEGLAAGEEGSTTTTDDGPVEATPAAPAEMTEAPTSETSETNETDQPGATVPVAADDTDATHDTDATDDSNRIGDLLVSTGAVDRTDVEFAATRQEEFGDHRKLGKILVADGRTSQAEVDQAAAKQRGSEGSGSIRVDVAVLDELMNLVGELVLSRNQIMQLAGLEHLKEFTAPAQRLNLITSELQEGFMQTRMQPIGNVWNKLPRVIRDLSGQLDKQIRVEMHGEETELDRTILEAIKDPLTHMVRNTADHGIESPTERRDAGKDAEGVLKLSAWHEAGQVHIEIADDGRGISADVMRVKCVEKGLITADEADRMTDAQAIQLIFRPGFSTAQAVSNVSGRGVGMDVVRTNIERIGGSVEVKTSPGEGTTFRITIPLTLAIIQAIIVQCDGTRYAVPQLSLQELVRLDVGERIEEVRGVPVFRLRDRLLPIVDLREQLSAESVERGVGTSIVVLRAEGHAFGLVVDAIEDTEEIVVKPLGRSVKDIDRFSGATIMGDGSVALILDVTGIANASRVLSAGSPALEEAADLFENADRGVDDRTILTVSLGDGSEAALSLSQIDRLEEFAADRVESSANSNIVQYRGEIMPLLDLGPQTGRGRSAFADRDRVNVVVCKVDGVSVGIAVDRVLDIVSDPEIRWNAEGNTETAIVKGHVVDVLDLFALIQRYVPLSEKPENLTGAAS